MSSVILNEYAVKLTASLQDENTRYLAREIRLQNQAARTQRGGVSPLGRALTALGQRLGRFGQQWSPLKGEAWRGG
jgi:hypothetical protein